MAVLCLPATAAGGQAGKSQQRKCSSSWLGNHQGDVAVIVVDEPDGIGGALVASVGDVEVFLSGRCLVQSDLLLRFQAHPHW